jgi:hypothetical protein
MVLQPLRWAWRLALPFMVVMFGLALLPGAEAARAETPEPLTAQEPQLLYLPVGTTGVDISWPQCRNGERPQGLLHFAVLGVNGGKMNTRNDCLADMYRWGMGGRTIPQVYVNTNGLPADYTNKACPPKDVYCNAYYYGYEGAAMAVAYARASNADPRQWWLDVETGNAWGTDQFANGRVLLGLIEYLQATGHTLGVYSTPYQWGRIVGAAYAPGLPAWTAGAANLAEAMTRCTDRYAFGGGKVAMVQYISEHFDTNYVCPGAIRTGAVIPGLTAAN